MKKNKRKFRWSNLIIVLLILAMVGIGGYMLADKFLPTNMSATKQELVSKVIPKRHKSISSSERTRISKQLMRQTQTKQGLTKQGFVSIPDVGILQPIFNDAYSDKGLSAGANYANRSEQDPEGKDVPAMGQDNYGLASHNFNDGKTGFSALQKKTNADEPYLVNGQLKGSDWLNGKFIYLANGTNIYKYKITGQKLVDKDDVSVLNHSKTAKVTIISCLFPSIQYRIITSGKLVKSYTWNKAPADVVTLFNLEKQPTNVHASWFNPGTEEGSNGDAGGTKTVSK
ncbi:class A sortase [Furfurilactobacillus entadae]|uniref:class A sortase n=1 Tax=Furfurilactobacillus entadae TaxID=2922307 RepID=UPI0038B411EB